MMEIPSVYAGNSVIFIVKKCVKISNFFLRKPSVYAGFRKMKKSLKIRNF